MSDTQTTAEPTHVLIVDDNRNYREAFRRNLVLQGYEVLQAGDSDEALALISQGEPLDVLVTDLSMRQPTEGLDLIRQARSLKPHLPIVMISAVGTFEEGAEANRLGARWVISKSKIDEEMSHLFTIIDRAREQYHRALAYAERLSGMRERAEAEPAKVAGELRQILMAPDAPETIRGEAFDMLANLDSGEVARETRQDVDRLRSADADTRAIFEKVDANLAEALPHFGQLEHETREALRTAEFLYLHGERIEKAVDFSRSIGFSYCFAVENEAKNRMRKRLQRFFGDSSTPALIRNLLENNQRSVSLFFHQHLLRVQRETQLEVTIDNVFQTFQRILDHGGKYKPDGLKALGIVVLCFGRSYSFKRFQQEVRVDNPLGLKNFPDEASVLQFASLLTNLQHFRNPYIHPEISEMEKLSKIRQTSFDCIGLMRHLD